MRLKHLLSMDWDAIAGVLAAIVAVVLHFLHIADQAILLPIILVLIALLFIRDLRRERKNERLAELIGDTAASVAKIQSALRQPDVILIGPRQLRVENEAFARQARGEMIFFNVCLLMYKSQQMFDLLLRPCIENPLVTSILFILDDRQKDLWRAEIAPKIAACRHSKNVREPRWCDMHENISFILSETNPEGAIEALLSFWGEPFMSHTVGKEVPRYIFRVRGHSDLIPRFTELERSYRFQS